MNRSPEFRRFQHHDPLRASKGVGHEKLEEQFTTSNTEGHLYGARSFRSPFVRAFPAGHFYSALPDIRNIRLRHRELFDLTVEGCEGVELRAPEQLELLRSIASFQSDWAYGSQKPAGRRYHCELGPQNSLPSIPDSLGNKAGTFLSSLESSGRRFTGDQKNLSGETEAVGAEKGSRLPAYVFFEGGFLVFAHPSQLVAKAVGQLGAHFEERIK
jgi:hypothetical protein